MKPNRTIGLIGPGASGKTHFKVFLLGRRAEVSPYIQRLYSVMQFREAVAEATFSKTRENPAIDSVLQQDNVWIHQRHRHNKDLSYIEIKYRENEKAPPTPFAVTICDFPGEFFSPEFLASDTDDYETNLATNLQHLSNMDELIMIVPFWHLLAPDLVTAFTDPLGPQVLDSVLNNRMALETHTWIEALNTIYVKDGERFDGRRRFARPPRRRLTIALSQCGGRIMRSVLEAARGLASPSAAANGSVEALNDLVAVVARLGQLERVKEVGLRQTAEAVSCLRRLQHAARAFLLAGERAGNGTAEELVALVGRRPEMLAFNIVDDQTIELTFAEQPTTFFREALVNAHLVLVRFWQQAARDLRW